MSKACYTKVAQGALLFQSLLFATACRSPAEANGCDPDAVKGELRVNEIVAKNEGVWIDELGATEDFVELVNAGKRTLRLSDFRISDREDQAEQLPDVELEVGQRVIVHADGEPSQGDGHLSFKLASGGETLHLSTCGKSLEATTFPALSVNESYARFPDATGDLEVCRYTTPSASNGQKCAPPVPEGLELGRGFAAFEFPDPHPELPGPLAISELALRPAGFIELWNTGDAAVQVSDYTLRIAPIAPGVAFPGSTVGTEIALGAGGTLAPGERQSFPVAESDLAELTGDPAFEGVATLFDGSAEVVDRVDFMRWPEGAVLARPPEAPERFVFCEQSSPGEAGPCEILAQRDVGDRVRGLRTLGDFKALAEGGTELGLAAVKFIVDVDQSDTVHFLRGEDWALHYTFIREVIEGEAPLDRCDSEQRALFDQGWYDFSVAEYFSTIGRHYYLGTLVQHGSSGHQTVEHTLGDAILGSDIRRSFFAVTSRVLTPSDWAFRPQDASQNERAREIEGTLPIIETNAPFAELVYQPLTHGIGYGVLTFVPASELHQTPLGAQTLLVTDDVPNDIPLVGGLVTQAFQTPLAHVNVLSQNRGTPNMALRDALLDERISENLGKLVRLQVRGDDFTIEEASAEEAALFWENFLPSGPAQTPRLDAETEELVDLKDASHKSLPTIGAKAAQLAELGRAARVTTGICANAPEFSIPRAAFAVPVAHFLRHYRESGARELFQAARLESKFQSDPLYRASVLEKVQDAILKHPVDEALLSEVTSFVWARFVSSPVRFRSSSNAEDLPGFNGAGLYTSTTAGAQDPSHPIDDALRVVWASLFNARAYDERELARVEHDAVAMGVLVHEAFPFEAANGVGVSRNILDPIRGDIYYLNSQAGEASVTNPAPGVTTEALEFQWPPRTPLINFQSQSSLSGGEPVMSQGETIAIACALRSVHEHFRPLIDPEGADPWFAMEVEFKVNHPHRTILVKQARPHTFGGFALSTDCREF